ncbi:MAG: hypothetical protein COA42_08140 [Alteromonadaceae bacterium]|nr:MAG: hypothetical protein COA42_08140 [Alteromonadaceae bacterium]
MLAEHGQRFPDLTFTIVDSVCEPGKCAVRVRYAGAHVGEWEGAGPTGKSFSVEEYMFFYFKNYLITEVWTVIDSPHKMKQIGFYIIPPQDNAPLIILLLHPTTTSVNL